MEEFTTEWLLNMLDKHNVKFRSKVKKVTTEDICNGNGYCSKILKTSIHFDDPTTLPYTFVMKIPTEDYLMELLGPDTEVQSVENIDKEKRKQLLAHIISLHNVECGVYDLIKDINDFPLPKIFYMQKGNEHSNGVIIMEDLSETCVAIGNFGYVTQELCLQAAIHFADFQAYIQSLGEEKWRGKFQGCSYIHELKKSERKSFHIAQEHNNRELKDQIQFFLDVDWHKFSSYTVRDKAVEYDASTLCHGDAWTNNMLIRVNKDKSVSNTFGAFIDWSMLFEGNPVYDLSRVFITCTDAEVRRAIETKAVDVYYDRLIEKMKANNQQVRFTREQAHELYELACLQEMQVLIQVFTLFVLPQGNEAKSAKMWLRLRMALEDAHITIEKYNLRKLFGLKND